MAKLTEQEKRLYWDIREALALEVSRVGGCECQGFHRATEQAIMDLIEAALDSKVHNGTLREIANKRLEDEFHDG